MRSGTLPAMGYALSGWVEFVVEVRFVAEGHDQFGEFLKGLQEPELMYATLLPSGGGAQSLGALLPDQTENHHWVRVAGPAVAIGWTMTALQGLCDRVFPRVTGEDGLGQ